jgi:Ca2+-binding RTX toxin-like protein
MRKPCVDDQGTVESVVSLATNAIINANDAPTGDVTIGNTVNAQQGDTLEVSNTLNDIDGMVGANVVYSWTNGTNQIATGSSYTLTQADVGSSISVVASYVDDFGMSESVASVATNSIINVNDVPTGLATAILAVGTEDIAYTISEGDLLVGFSDVDGDVLGVANLVASNGTLSADVTAGIWNFTPNANYNGSVTLAYDVIDGNNGLLSATQIFSLDAVNDAPIGEVNITGITTQNQTLTANTSTIVDADGLGIFSYQWQVNGVAVGTNAPTYTLAFADVGKTMTLVASYTDKQGTVESLTSALTSAVVVAPVTTGGKTIIGSKGNDKLVGTDGNDSISGGNGDDKLLGGAGNDLLKGEKGDDLLTGGTGADLFVFVNNAGDDKILDFKPSKGDKIQLSADTGITALNLSNHIKIENNGIEIEFAEGKVLLVGVTSLDVGDVIFG